MRVLGILSISIAVAWTLSCPAAGQSTQRDRTQRDRTQRDRTQASPDTQKAQRRKPVKVVDIAPETATHTEQKPLAVTFKRLTALRICDDDSLLACDGDEKVIKLINPAGIQTGTIQLPFAPEAIDIAADGSLYCGGAGQLAKLDANGVVLYTEPVPVNVAPSVASDSDTGVSKQTPSKEKTAAPRRRRKPRPQRISGIAVTDTDVFVAFGSGWSTSSKSKLYRFNLKFKQPKMLAEGLRGCCQRCDIKCRDGELYLAENSAHRVVIYDREGTVVKKWGERGRNDLKSFGACCNPMNVCFDNDGVLYTAESGLGRIKKYTTDGQFLDLVGYVGTDRFWNGSGLAASCSNIAIAATGDGKRVYVMDFKNSQIRVLAKKAQDDHAEPR